MKWQGKGGVGIAVVLETRLRLVRIMPSKAHREEKKRIIINDDATNQQRSTNGRACSNWRTEECS